MKARLYTAVGYGPLTLSAGLSERVREISLLLGGYANRYPEAYHTLDDHTLWHLDDWHGHERNLTAEQHTGSEGHLYGPVLLVPQTEGETNRAEREHQQRFFAALARGTASFA